MDEHLSQAQLRARVHEASAQVVVGGRYRHYKGGEYVVVELALIEATNEPAVVYRAEYGEGITFIRPLTDWFAQVTYDGQVLPRFTLITA